MRFPAPKHVSFQLDADRRADLEDSPTFAISWELARLVAPFDPRSVRAELVRNWDAVSRRCDPLEVLELADVIRQAAIYKYLANEVEVAVRKLLKEVAA